MTTRTRRRLTILTLALLLPVAISQLLGCMCLRNFLNGGKLHEDRRESAHK